MTILTRIRRLFRPHPTPTGLAVQRALNGEPEELRAIMREVDAERATLAETGRQRFAEQRERVCRGEAARDGQGRFVGERRLTT